MSERQPYEKPQIKSETLSFEQLHRPDGRTQRARKAKTDSGDIFVKTKDRYFDGNTTEEEVAILKKAQAGGVNVEIPFAEERKDRMVVMSEGKTLGSSIEQYSIEQLKIILKNIAEQIAKLHHLNIKQGDFHTDNITIDPKTLKVSLIDFSGAVDYTEKPINFDIYNDIYQKLANDFDNIFLGLYIHIFNNPKENKRNRLKFEKLREDFPELMHILKDSIIENYRLNQYVADQLKKYLESLISSNKRT
ncbi:MAG TPA: hypothetical protein DEB09_00845 [Candidatus Magasanikbacteria bacterium]|nr:hypothetical protein [Candidatus Magasanikbacteria bacterium]